MHEYTTPFFGSVLCPVGYVEPGAVVWVQEQMSGYKNVYLLDIRLKARSRWFPDWNKGKLQKTWGERYLHDPRLGNKNHRDRELPIQLADPLPALRDAAMLLRDGYSLVVLCACKDYERCHRKMVVEWLLQRCQDAVRSSGMCFDIERNLYRGFLSEDKHRICVQPGVFDFYRLQLAPPVLYNVDTWVSLSYKAQSDEIWAETNRATEGRIQDASPLV